LPRPAAIFVIMVCYSFEQSPATPSSPRACLV
jgi:hypothetical protein